MVKFKVGDVVERMGRASSVWRRFVAQDSGPYTVTSTAPGGWIQLNGYVTYCAGWSKHPFDEANFKLIEQDDPLPPAPESALYVNKWRWGVGVRSLGDEVQIGTGDPNSCNHGWTYATLDPDAALQLAHDLNRMANEIKRKGKQQERKTTLSPAIAHPYGE